MRHPQTQMRSRPFSQSRKGSTDTEDNHGKGQHSHGTHSPMRTVGMRARVRTGRRPTTSQCNGCSYITADRAMQADGAREQTTISSS